LSYDLAFWKETPKCRYDAGAIYRRLRRGLAVDGLSSIPRNKARKIIKSLLGEYEEVNGQIQGRLQDALVDVALFEEAIFVSFPIGASALVEIFINAFAPLGVSPYDPQGAPSLNAENLYDLDYAEISEDPDIDYWVSVKLEDPAPLSVPGAVSLGGQVVLGIAYSFYNVAEPTENFPSGIFSFYEKILAGHASIPIERFNCVNLDGYGTIAVLIVVPGELIERCANGFEPRKHIKMFSALATDDKVLYYSDWNPPPGVGMCATIITLKEMPTRLKTIISSRFIHRG